MGYVKVHGEYEPNTFHGSKDGYSYRFLESNTNGHMLYELTNPQGVSKLIEVNADSVVELRTNPAQFWMNYVR